MAAEREQFNLKGFREAGYKASDLSPDGLHRIDKNMPYDARRLAELLELFPPADDEKRQGLLNSHSELIAGFVRDLSDVYDLSGQKIEKTGLKMSIRAFDAEDRPIDNAQETAISYEIDVYREGETPNDDIKDIVYLRYYTNNPKDNYPKKLGPRADLYLELFGKKVDQQFLNLSPGQEIRDEDVSPPKIMDALRNLSIGFEANRLLDQARALPEAIQKVVQEELEKAGTGGQVNWQELEGKLAEMRRPLEEYTRGYQRRQEMIAAGMSEDDIERLGINKKVWTRNLAVDKQAGKEVVSGYQQGGLVDLMCRSAHDLSKGKVDKRLVDWQFREECIYKPKLDDWGNLIITLGDYAGPFLLEYIKVYGAKLPLILKKFYHNPAGIAFPYEVSRTDSFLYSLKDYGLKSIDREQLGLVMARAFMQFPKSYFRFADVQEDLLDMAKTRENMEVVLRLLEGKGVTIRKKAREMVDRAVD